MTRVLLENVRVDFPIYGGQQRSLRTAIFNRAAGGLIRREGQKNERIVVRALNDVSLRLQEGDRVGLIGHNGSGKSTLLKVIAGIYAPVSGSCTVYGRVTPLFDMMPGLDPEDTGYENIITSGMLLGMSRDQIENKIPEIEEACELGEYLTLPVRTYSTGMTLRLGFALVTALEPGVLLIDEGFGTGDLRFAERAAARMNDFIGRSRVMVLASHSDAMIRSVCNKAVLMREGRVLEVGPVDELLESYNFIVHGSRAPMAASAGKTMSNNVFDRAKLPGKPGCWNLQTARSKDLEVVQVELRGSRSGAAGRVATDEEIELSLTYRQHCELSKERVVLQLLTEAGEVAFTTTDQSIRTLAPSCAGAYTTTCVIPADLLNKGIYVIRVWAGVPYERQLLPKSDLGWFIVEEIDDQAPAYETDAAPGVLRPKLKWRLVAEEPRLAIKEVERVAGAVDPIAGQPKPVNVDQFTRPR